MNQASFDQLCPGMRQNTVANRPLNQYVNAPTLFDVSERKKNFKKLVRTEVAETTTLHINGEIVLKLRKDTRLRRTTIPKRDSLRVNDYLNVVRMQLNLQPLPL